MTSAKWGNELLLTSTHVYETTGNTFQSQSDIINQLLVESNLYNDYHILDIMSGFAKLLALNLSGWGMRLWANTWHQPVVQVPRRQEYDGWADYIAGPTPPVSVVLGTQSHTPSYVSGCLLMGRNSGGLVRLPKLKTAVVQWTTKEIGNILSNVWFVKLYCLYLGHMPTRCIWGLPDFPTK